MSSILNKFIPFLFIFQLVFPFSTYADYFESKNVIWRSGYNLFQLEEFDNKKYGNNEHPVSIDKLKIKQALLGIQVWEEDGFFSKASEEAETLFAPLTAERLAEHIANGLKRAKSNQDITFIIQSQKSKLLILKQKYVTSGRAFFRDGNLNIIIGDYQHPINDALEDVLDPGDTGRSATLLGLDEAKRKSSLFGFDSDMILLRGISQKVFNDKPRKNWLVINLDEASEAYLSDLKERQEQLRGRGEKQLEKEAALLAKQRREMRAEMARMRKQIDAMEKGDAQSSNAPKKSIEERMATLDALLAKELISKEEYDSKRQEILSDI